MKLEPLQEVTLETLEPIPTVQHLTRDNIRVGMLVRTVSGLPCSVNVLTTKDFIVG